jgi:hypothetical protein
MVGWATGRTRRLRWLSSVGVIALLALAGCTGRDKPPGDTATGCPVADGRDSGWQRVAVLAGSGSETSVEVTGLVGASSASGAGPWLAVGAARIGTPSGGNAPASTTPGGNAAGTTAPSGAGTPGTTAPGGNTPASTTPAGNASGSTAPGRNASATTTPGTNPAGTDASAATGPGASSGSTSPGGAAPPTVTGPTSGPTSTPTSTGTAATDTTVQVGGVGQPAAGSLLAPAEWTSDDGVHWARRQVEPVSLDGAADRLLGVARYADTAAAVGVTFNHNEGVARPSGWAARPGGPLREARANRELFGGPAGLGVSGVGAGPLGLAILGLRNGSDNHLFIAVWRSSDGQVWQPPRQDPALTARPAEAPAALGVAVGSNAIVVGGRTVQVDDPSDGVIWTGVATAPVAGSTAADPAAPLRWQRVDPAAAGLGGAGSQEVDRVAWTGSGFVAAGLAGEQGKLRLVSWTSRDGLTWSRGGQAPQAGVNRLTSLSADGSGLLAAGTAGSTACLWRSRDGRAWTADPLPPDAARLPGLQGAFAATGTGRALVILQGQGRAEVWSHASGRD